MVNIVHNIITLGTSIIVLQTLMNTLVAKAVATFCHVCLLSHIKADGTLSYLIDLVQEQVEELYKVVQANFSQSLEQIRLFFWGVGAANFIDGIQESREGSLGPSCYYGGLGWKL